MNLIEAKEHFKLAYMVRDVSHVHNHGEVIIYHETIKQAMTQIVCMSNKGLVVLVDQLEQKTAEITKIKSTRVANGERALNLIKQIVESGNDNPKMMTNIIGNAIFIEAKKIHELCQ